MDPQRLGHQAEAMAAGYLRRAGWRILDRNFRFGHKEIDVVAERDGTVIFVEVKARTRGGLGHALESITARKRRDLRVAARAWVARHGRGHAAYRFDVIWVERGRDGLRLEHVEAAWS